MISRPGAAPYLPRVTWPLICGRVLSSWRIMYERLNVGVLV